MTGNARTTPRHRPSRPFRFAGWLLAGCTLLAGCAATPPEEALRRSVQSLESAVEARDAGAVSELLAEDFAGPDGMDRGGAHRLARLSFLQHRDVGLVLGPLDLSLQGEHATVRFTAALAGGQGRWLPEQGSIYRVEIGWRRDGDAWRMTSARWERDL